MSTIGSNVSVNRQVNSLPQGGEYSVGLTIEQANDLKAIASTLYGSREGAKGGAGYVGAFQDSSGKIHLAKVMTHWNERIGLKKGSEEEYLQKLEKSNNPDKQKLAQTLRGATERLCNRLIDIARAVGKESDVAKMLGMKSKEGGGYVYPALLNREIGMTAIKKIVGGEGEGMGQLKMRADVLAGYDDMFDIDQIGKDRAQTVENTTAKSVVDNFAEAEFKDEIGQRVKFSGQMNESALSADEVSYFRFTEMVNDKIKTMMADKDVKNAMENGTAVSTEKVPKLSDIKDPDLISQARSGQALRLKKAIETLRFDGMAGNAFMNIANKMVALHQHVASRADQNVGMIVKNGESKSISDVRLEFSTGCRVELNNGQVTPFFKSQTNEVFVRLLKQGLREELASSEGRGDVPITPRELDEFMFRASRKAFVCAMVLDGVFAHVETLNKEIEKDAMAIYKLSGKERPKKQTIHMNWSVNGGETYDKIYKEISDANLFGEVKGENIEQSSKVSNDERRVTSALKDANIKRYRVVCANTLCNYSHVLRNFKGDEKFEHDNIVNALIDGAYYNRDKDDNKECLCRIPGELDSLLSNETNDYDKEDNHEDAFGKLLGDVTEWTLKGTLLKDNDPYADSLFCQQKSYGDRQERTESKAVDFLGKLNGDYAKHVF